MEPIEIDKEFEIPTYSEVCTYCDHLFDYGKGRKCKAFPSGIPLAIWMGENDHTKIHPDQDNDIIFELVAER